MDQKIEDFVKGKRVAMLGVSRSGKKFGNAIFTELKQRGYQVSIIHPEAKEIAGEPCYPNLAALKGQVDGVIICVKPEQAEKAVREAAQNGVYNVWLQQGSESPEALAAARELGITPVTGKCILMYAEPVGSLHGVHRFFAKVFGQL